MTTRCCVVVGDVVGSRSVADREALRADLEAGVRATNDELEDRLVAPFAILKGVDEVAGVLADPAGADRALWTLAEAIHPTTMRFALVQGEVDVGRDTGNVAEMDGPAFHEADEILDAVAADDRHAGLSFEDADEPVVVELLEGLVNLLLAWKSEWTERQAELVGGYREAESMTALARAEEVTVQVVSKTLARAGAQTVLRTESGIARGFEYLARET